ncbi:phosphotransferase enzyme family protein [Streptomyces violascens]|uniref:phosphotransferase enzyme family protein n=1 Tax=Streptomyces violascens TaxID=67381 RepID=UPI00369EA3CB
MHAGAEEEISAVSALLQTAYDIKPSSLSKGPLGTATRNYIARDTEGRLWFVKVYPLPTDLAGEQQALELTNFAGQAGVPVTVARRTSNGSLIASADGVAFSVCEYLTGTETAVGGLRGKRWPAVGTLVGHMHRGLAHHPSGRPPRLIPSQEVCQFPDAHRRLAALVARYEARTPRTDFERWAIRTARERLASLPDIADKLEKLPPLMTVQVVHGDLTGPNLLLRGDDVAAVIDFRPPEPRSPVWELGRMLTEEQTVCAEPDWLSGLVRAVSAYHSANPSLPTKELQAILRVATGYLASSVYPLREPLDHPDATTSSMEAYGYVRHKAAGVLLEHLDDAEEELRKQLS